MKNILVVDDDWGIVDFIENTLQREGFSTISTDSGFEALEILKSSDNISLIITDLKLPFVPGIDIVEEGLKKDIPYILISGGKGTATHVQHLRSLGYEINDDNYLPKPFEICYLTNLVKRKLLVKQSPS